jgi:type I restriction enzyme S subunit
MRLEKVCKLITDGKHGDCKDEDGSGYFFISAKNVRSGKIIYENARQITKQDFVQTNRRTQLEPLDILIVSTGATIGRMALVSDNKHTRRTTFQKSVAIIKPDNKLVSPHWLYYKLQHIKDFIINLSGGTAQGNLLLRDIRDLDIEIPPIELQKKIAYILSAFDTLIENNTRRIKILEEMAQAIYQEWFVHYRFPGHEYMRSVDSGLELGKIPDGWKIEELGNLVEFQKGKKPKNVFDIPNENSLPLLLIESLRDAPKHYTDDMSVIQVSNEDIIMVMDGASSGEVFIGKDGAIGSTIGVYRPLDKVTLSPYYLFQYLFTNFRAISDNNTGAAIPHANKDFIQKMKILLPPKVLLSYYNEIICPYYRQSQLLLLINRNLRTTRDLLLPKIINGEIDVSKIDIPTG